MCASNCTSDIKSENGFEHPNVTTSNVPTMVGMLLLYNRACPKGNGVLCLNRSTPDHSLFEWSFVWGCMVVRQWTFVIAIAFVIGVGVGVQLPTRTVAPPSAPISIGAFFTPGTECEDRIIAEINRATTIDIAVYSITNPKIANAIIATHRRGARVRIVTDRTMAGHKSSMIDELVAAGIPVRVNRRHKIEHNKFAVFDNQRMVTGSYNWTTAATKYNSENCIFLTHPVQEYSKRFEYLWGMYK